MNPTRSHRYLLHGLVIDSSMSFPELPPAVIDGSPDVVIAVGKTRAALDHPLRQGGCYQAEPEEFLIWLEGTARFLVSHGREIRVDPEIGADAAEVGRLLLSSPLGALLLQRGLLPFHASAVAINGAGVMFIGGPCAGKSTFAARAIEQGFRVLSDDITAVRFDDQGQPMILPGCAELKLWRDSLTALGRDYALLPSAGANLTKRVLRFPETFDPEPVPLRTIYWLEPDRRHDLLVTTTAGSRGLAALLHHSYRAGFIAGAARQRTHFLQIARLAKTVRIMTVKRPEERFVDREFARTVVEDLRR